MVRILALRRRDLHAVARDSPDLLHIAVAEACWMIDVSFLVGLLASQAGHSVVALDWFAEHP